MTLIETLLKSWLSSITIVKSIVSHLEDSILPLKIILILIIILLLILYILAEPLYCILLIKVPTSRQVGGYRILVPSIYRISYIYTRLIPT